MKEFLGKDYLLDSAYASKLFYKYAQGLPIIDYHCHLDPCEIYGDKVYSNITQVWLYGDHYKWRLMRTAGVGEQYITGNASDWHKFEQYIKTLQYAIDSPLYHWSALELKRCFDIDEIICEKNAETIWNKANEYIKSNALSPSKALAQFKVDALCTTDEGFSRLEYHKLIAEQGTCPSKILPTFRADKLVQIDKEIFLDALYKLAEVTNIDITNYAHFLQALDKQLKYFASLGCILSDVSLESLYYTNASYACAEKALEKRMDGKKLMQKEADAFIWHTLRYLIATFSQLGWVTQLHIGAVRNNNTLMYQSLGADTGYDSISELPFVDALSKLFDSLNNSNELSKVVVYTLNPIYYSALTSMLGCFQSKDANLQLGAAWWFNDNIQGIKEQMSKMSTLSHFAISLGMLTDSRSFLSFVRHEFYRRILCSFLGDKVEKGEFPASGELLEKIVKDICYYNVKRYLNL